MLRDVSMAGAWPLFVDVCCAKSFLSRVFSAEDWEAYILRLC